LAWYLAEPFRGPEWTDATTLKEKRLMKTKTIFSAFVIASATLIAACGGKSSDSNKVIKSTTAGNLTITLASPTGELKSGDNQLTITFADSSGKPLDVGAASLNFHMPAMGSMSEMNDKATLTTTNTPGRYRANVTLEVGGTWEAQVKYQGAQGTGQASLTVIAK
jgi:hypothetical protein